MLLCLRVRLNACDRDGGSLQVFTKIRSFAADREVEPLSVSNRRSFGLSLGPFVRPLESGSQCACSERG